jgi:hemerythrin-like metal-binding protein
VAKHKIFHIEAGKIAKTINMKKYLEAESMLGANTDYSKASSEVVVAILHLKKEITDDKKPAFFTWSDELSVGNHFIDNDHKKLIQMINNFHKAIQEGRGDEVICKVLHNLAIYTREHFKREEDEMVRIKYPMFAEHKKQHEQLLKQFSMLQNDFNNEKKISTTQIAEFLKGWLYNHILQTDKLLAIALSKI